ncbi:MAG: hypothetical protein KatS3mg115_2270 [Candidatus Poribacteria bacterium]|nr:MAG: hypothetical protein KatS3mg115_2270 [Candidatus Poribacteria bacterium]
MLDFLQAEGIPYRHDPMNEDAQFLRSRIRHHLLPTLAKEYNPRIRRVLAQTATILAAEDELLAQMTEAAWRRVFRGNGLDLELFLQEPIAIQRRLLHRWLQNRLGGRPPSFSEVERAREFAHRPDANGVFLTRNHRLVIQQQGQDELVAPQDRWVLAIVQERGSDFPALQTAQLRIPGDHAGRRGARRRPGRGGAGRKGGRAAVAPPPRRPLTGIG